MTPAATALGAQCAGSFAVMMHPAALTQGLLGQMREARQQHTVLVDKLVKSG